MYDWGGGYAVEVLRLPDVPVQCRPIRVGEEGLGQGRERVCWVIFRGLQLADVRRCWQCGAWGQFGVEWSYTHRQHTQYGRLAMRLRVGRACGRCVMLMVKLHSVVCASGAGVGSGGG